MSFEAVSNPFVLDVKDQTEKSPRSSDWDARLAVARAKRAKVLAEQAAEPKKKGANKHPFLLADVDLHAETAAFLSDDSDASDTPSASKQAEIATPQVVTPPAAAPLVTSPDVAASENADPVAAPVTASARFSRLGLILVGCFTGLGLGFALGLGLLIGAGWVSPSQFATKAVDPVKPAAKTPVAMAPPVSAVPASVPSVAMTAGPVAGVLSDSGPVVAGIAPVTDMPSSASSGSGAAKTQWVQDLTIAPHAQLPTTVAADAERSMAQFQTLQSNNPADVLGAYAPLTSFGSDPSAQVRYASISPNVQSDATAPVGSGAATTAWVDSVAINPHAQLSTQTEGDAGLSLARFQMLDSNNPAKSLSGYTPSPVTVADQTLPSPGVQYASLGSVPFEMPTLPQTEIAFIAPSMDASVVPQNTSLTLPASLNTAGPAPVWPNVEAPVAAYVPVLPVELNFAQSLGLSESQTQAFSLTLLAPDQTDDAVLSQYGATLGETGLPLTKTQKVAFTISKPHIRFYNKGSEAVATALADTLGIEARNFTTAGRSTTGIEVWMAGASTQQVAKPRVTQPRKSVPRQKTATQVRSQLSNSIINGLRNATK